MEAAFEDSPEFWKAIAERVVRYARSGAKRRKVARWIVVMNLTSHGSTYSRDLCRYFGVDPDEKV